MKLYEWLVVGLVWLLIPFCLVAAILLERRWLRKFGERKPR
jgi:hypothetical protein